MPEIQLGSHTIRSHGVKVAKVHMHDWLILLLLAVIDVVLNVIEPFHRFVGEDMMDHLKYPLKDNTIPFWGVPIIAVLLPLFVITVYYFIRKDVYDLHQAILGLLFSVFITAVLTDSIKDAVGRPRPDFFWRCFPNGKGVFDPVTKGVICNGIKSVIKEGHKSFPSGHTSCWGPHAYFQMLAESQNENNDEPSFANANAFRTWQSEMGSVHVQPRVNSRESSLILAELESGRRH